eukprot:g33663.t1
MSTVSAAALVDNMGMKPIGCREANVEENIQGELEPRRDPTGGETPETGTPLTRSLSPSSDGGAESAADRSERGASRRQLRRRSLSNICLWIEFL